MDTLVRLLMIGILCCVWSERAVARAGEVRREYEPLVFAAVPLHAPVPVLHVLSPAPARTSRRPLAAAADLDLEESAVPTPRYKPHRLRPPASLYRDADYDESYEYTRPLAPGYEDESYASPSHAHPTRAYSTSHLYSTSVVHPPPDVSSAETALLYARPSPSGGYTYRRPAPKATVSPPLKLTKEPPYIIKIHKYRIVKDRRRRRR